MPLLLVEIHTLEAERASHQCLPVNDAEEVVEQSKDDKLSVKEFIDATLPAQKQVKEGPQTCISNSPGVSHCHSCCFFLANLLVGCVLA